MKISTIAAALSVLAAGQAVAGGPEVVVEETQVVPAAAPAPGFDWTGFYVGATLGYGDVETTTATADSNAYGLQAGYLRDLGNFVLGGEIAFVTGDFDEFPDTDFDSTRLKLIGGYAAGRFLPYVFLGVSDYKIDDGASTASDTATLYGLGAHYALGVTGQHVVGLEYLVESVDNFAGTGNDLDNHEVSIRYDFRF
jgi:hypothetical protein